MLRRMVAVSVGLIALATSLVGRAGTVEPPSGYLALVGPLHEHSGYSDGWPGSTPATYYASAKSFGNDFLASGEHSDSADLPTVLSENCLDPGVFASCAFADPDPVNSFRKWDATLEYARAATDASFVGIRGFEWTSDVFGHINVYFSTHDANAKTDGGYGVTTETFWQWFSLPTIAGGGDDGLGVFNHPGSKCSLGETHATCNWNDFTYRPEADARMVGVEVYNDTREYGSRGPGAGYYVRALDRGWHVGAVGAEDLGHRTVDQWGGPQWAKTVILATARTSDAIEEAMQARRFYAVRYPSTRMEFTVDGEIMGSRLTRSPGEALALDADITDAVTLEVVTSGGTVVTSGPAPLSTAVTTSSDQRYYFVRARAANGSVIAYSSPVWVTAA